MAAFYICYQSLLEPLTQTQVVAYLEGLALAGHQILLLTFEPIRLTDAETQAWRTRMQAKGISWHWLAYHKRPTLPATVWDILTGVLLGWRLARQYGIRLVHARTHVPGVMALTLKWLTGAKFLFDIRGFMAEEYADAGIWSQDGLLFRLTKRAERFLVKKADGIVVLTEKAKTLLRQWYPAETADKPVEVIPCCVDLRHLPPNAFAAKRESPDNSAVTLVYAGKLGGWYPVHEMVQFFSAATKVIPALGWKIWTQSDPSQLRQELEAGGLVNVTIASSDPAEILSKLMSADVGLSLYKRRLSAAGCSPTKIGEYLAAGLPVVSSTGIGDVDELLRNGENGPVGVLVQDSTSLGYYNAALELGALLQDPCLRDRCRAVAQKYLDLEQIGWVRYRKIYSGLIGVNTP